MTIKMLGTDLGSLVKDEDRQPLILRIDQVF